MVKIGIIGGSGLENPEILKDATDISIKTNYGVVSLKIGRINDVDVVLLLNY